MIPREGPSSGAGNGAGPGPRPHLLSCDLQREFLKTRFSRCMFYRHNAAIGTDCNLFFGIIHCRINNLQLEWVPGQSSWARIFWRLFSKRCIFESKSGTKSLVRRYQDKLVKTVPDHLKVCHIWLIKFKTKLCLVIFFIHIIQLSLFISEYLPFYLHRGSRGGGVGKMILLTWEKGSNDDFYLRWELRRENWKIGKQRNQKI